MDMLGRSAPTTAQARRSLRRLLLLGGSIYLAWWFVVRALLPGSYNALAGRLVVVAFFYGVVAATFFSEWMKRHLESGLIAGIWLLTIHYYYLFYRNGGDTAWAIGAYVVAVGASALLSSRPSLLAYSLLTLAIGILVSVVERPLLHSIFLPGLATMIGLSNVTLRNRLLLEEERAELARTQTARAAAEADVALRDEFISIASHELNSPLATLKLTFNQLSRNVVREGDVPSPGVQRSLERCERQLVRLVRLVEALLDVSRITNGVLALRVESVCLLEAVRHAVQAVSADAAGAGSRIDVGGDPSVGGQWDPTRIEQLVTNLLRNALAFGRGFPIRVSVTGDARKARLSVVDEGIGIAREQQARIFGRFERAVPSQHYGGLGLGLYVVKQVVDAHGGSVRVESQPGRGAARSRWSSLSHARTSPRRRGIERGSPAVSAGARVDPSLERTRAGIVPGVASGAIRILMIREDYVERMIKELASAVARIMGLVSDGERTAATRELDACYRALGVDRNMITRLDTNTLARMLGAAKSEALAGVLEAEASLSMSDGREGDAASKKRDAAALRQVFAR